MDTPVAPITPSKPNKIYRELIKSEAQLIVGTLNTLIRFSAAKNEELEKTPHHGERMASDWMYGYELKENYQSGVNRRVTSIVEALYAELSLPVNPGEIGYYDYPDLDQSQSVDTKKLQEIATKIIELAAQL